MGGRRKTRGHRAPKPKWSKARAAFERSVDRWKSTLGLNPWQINVDWFDGPLTDVLEGSDRHSVVADCKASWQYMEARIRVNEPLLAEKDEQFGERLALHELLHCVVRGAEIPDSKMEERLVTELSNAFEFTARDK